MIESSYNCNCYFCKHKHDFDLPSHLIEDLFEKKVALFVGAGVSTENRNVLKFTLFDTIKGELGFKEESNLAFPDLVQELEDQPNGRIRLLELIQERLDHIKSFPELYRVATRFHQELSTFYPLDTIVTTNWDTYFEDECDATPFVTDSDLAFWHTDKRKVLKIHGSINNYGSIIATRNDYQKSLERLHKDILGSKLKEILATKTVLFIGYSFEDSDFKQIYDFVSEQMKEFKRDAYVITPFQDEGDKFNSLGLNPIITDGTFFINQLKAHAINENLMLPDAIYEEAKSLLDYVTSLHHAIFDQINIVEHPELIYTACFQDGLIHALDRMIALKSCGVYSRPGYMEQMFEPYFEWQDEKRKEGKFEDVAYIDGYLNAYQFLLLSDEEKEEFEYPPLYYAFGTEHNMLFEIDELIDIIDELPTMHKKSSIRAQEIIDKLDEPVEDIIFHHPPWL